ITTNLAKAKSGVTVVVKEWLARVAELGHVRCKRRSMETDTAGELDITISLSEGMDH
ncbi:hypothetical protein XENORESO_016625, partial [Xenotaenia resolanae]